MVDRRLADVIKPVEPTTPLPVPLKPNKPLPKLPSAPYHPPPHPPHPTPPKPAAPTTPPTPDRPPLPPPHLPLLPPPHLPLTEAQPLAPSPPEPPYAATIAVFALFVVCACLYSICRKRIARSELVQSIESVFVGKPRAQPAQFTQGRREVQLAELSSGRSPASVLSSTKAVDVASYLKRSHELNVQPDASTSGDDAFVELPIGGWSVFDGSARSEPAEATSAAGEDGKPSALLVPAAAESSASSPQPPADTGSLTTSADSTVPFTSEAVGQPQQLDAEPLGDPIPYGDSNLLFEDELATLGLKAENRSPETLAEAISRGPTGFGLEIHEDELGRGAVAGISGVALTSALRVGDRILKVNGVETPTHDQVLHCLRAAAEDAMVTLLRDPLLPPLVQEGGLDMIDMEL